jgi:hypothetical protein
MSTFPKIQPYFGTYFVQDQKNEEELLRLVGQDRDVTASIALYFNQGTSSLKTVPG